MKKPAHYWIKLLVDVSLDRAQPVLPMIGFPAGDHLSLQKAIDDCRNQIAVSALGDDSMPLVIAHQLNSRLKQAARPVLDWLLRFPYSDDENQPAVHYWSNRFMDYFGLTSDERPTSLDAKLWQDLIDAFRGVSPDESAPWYSALSQAAETRRRYKAFIRAVDNEREKKLSAHDLKVYVEMGWNDEGMNQGLSSLEVGADLGTVRDFWRAIAPAVPEADLIDLAAKRDLENWREASKPEHFFSYAQRYGRPPEAIAAEMFPRPGPPPSLSSLLGSR